MTRNEENCTILARHRAGDKKALAELCKLNERLVGAAAREYHNDSQELEDFVNEAWVGFLTAVEEYEIGRGFAFTTFAFMKIRQHLVDTVRGFSTVGRRMPGVAVELDENLPAVENDALDDIITDHVRVATATLPEPERKVIEARYYNHESQAATAARLGMSRQRVQRLEASALATLRDALA